MTSNNLAKVYNLSTKSIPSWITQIKRTKSKKKQKKQLREMRHDPNFYKRVEVLQYLSFPSSCQHIDITPDQKYLIAAGEYKPLIKVFDLDQLSLKYETHVDARIEHFISLSSDYSKMAILRTDRFIDFHVRGSVYYKIRIPKFGRQLAFQNSTSDLFIACSESTQVYKLNLEKGQFTQPLTTKSTVTTLDIAPRHLLIGMGSVNGDLQLWDPRIHERLCTHSISHDDSITKVKFSPNSLRVACGTDTGRVHIYDLRMSKPLFIKDHYYDEPITAIHFPSNSSTVWSVDTKICKIWNPDVPLSKTPQPSSNGDNNSPFSQDNISSYSRSDGSENIAFIEQKFKIRSSFVWPNSGLCFFGGDSSAVSIHYLPSLGDAPDWCSFVDLYAQEVEEAEKLATSENGEISSGQIYDDYQFVTPEQLSDLQLDDLVGKSDTIRPYMHGYFIPIKLYNQAQAQTNPLAYQQYRKQKIKQKIDSMSADRIESAVFVKKPKVNANIVEDNPDIAVDPRFSSLFTNPAFQIEYEEDDE